MSLTAAMPIALGAVVANLPTAAMAAGLSTLNTGAVLARFTAGWLAGLSSVTALGLLLVDGAVAASDSAAWVSWLRVVLGLTLLALGVRKLVQKMQNTGGSDEPGWVRATRTLTGGKAFGTAFLLGSANPKSSIIALSAVAVIVDATPAVWMQIAAAIVFVAVSSVSVAAPGLAILVLGDRARTPLTRFVDGFVRRSRIITIVILLLLGAYVAANGLAEIGSAL